MTRDSRINLFKNEHIRHDEDLTPPKKNPQQQQYSK